MSALLPFFTVPLRRPTIAVSRDTIAVVKDKYWTAKDASEPFVSIPEVVAFQLDAT